MTAAKRRTDRRIARRVVREPEASYAGETALWKARDDPFGETALLLDTHVWIWTLDAADGTLSDAATALVQRAAANAQLFVSDISHWEVAMLVATRRLVLDQDVTVWLNRAAKAPGLQPLSLTRARLTTLSLGPHLPLTHRLVRRGNSRVGPAVVVVEHHVHRSLVAQHVHE